MPKLWSETIDAHRREVRDAIVDTTAGLVEERGLLSVTMSQIAEETGIGRATLYKYFPDVEAILRAWLEGHIDAHLAHLAEVRDRATGAEERLAGVLEAFALIASESHEHRDSELAAVLHRDSQIAAREHQLHHMLTDLLTQARDEGIVRDDVSPSELAGYCVHALGAARYLPSRAAVRRLIDITLDGLRTPG
ncbi:MAG: TetR/AcrR family transcriptional regulator [Actinomycetota bacterium]|nr:TetR/AcrR family transcriptional regulator [Actinomycetota bacterium]